MWWLAMGLALAFDFDGVAIEGETVKPAAQILLASPVRSGETADEARARIAQAEAAVAAASGPSATPGAASSALPGACMALGDAHAALAGAVLIDAYAAADEAFAAGLQDDLDLSAHEAALGEALRAWDRGLAAAAPATAIPATARPGTPTAATATRSAPDSAAVRAALLDRRAWALQQLGRDAEAVDVWQKLSTDHPGTPEARRAELSLAEHLFAQAAIDSAIPLYQRVAATDDDLGAYAAYKLAWCRYNLGAVAEAIDGLVRLRASAAASEMLAQEAARDAVMMASGLPIEDALGVIARLCDTDADCATTHRGRLADHYQDAGRLAEAEAVRGVDGPAAAPPKPTRGGRR